MFKAILSFSLPFLLAYFLQTLYGMAELFIIGQLEDEEITLDQSFKVYKEGMELLKYCNDTLDTVEKKVLKINESGELDEF